MQKSVFIFSFQSFLVDMLSLLEVLPQKTILDMQCFCLKTEDLMGNVQQNQCLQVPIQRLSILDL